MGLPEIGREILLTDLRKARCSATGCNEIGVKFPVAEVKVRPDTPPIRVELHLPMCEHHCGTVEPKDVCNETFWLFIDSILARQGLPKAIREASAVHFEPLIFLQTGKAIPK